MTEFTGDQEQLIRMALEYFAEGCREELQEIPRQIKDLQKREEELDNRLSEISSLLSEDFGGY